MSTKNEFAIKSAAYFHPVFKKTVPSSYIEVTGPDAKRMLDLALGERSRGDVAQNAEGTGFIVTGLNERAMVAALENLALVDAGEDPIRKTKPADDDTGEGAQSQA